MVAEHPEERSADPVEEHWTAYAEEVAVLPCLPEDQRPIASGLVYLRLARAFVRYGRSFERPSMFARADEEQAQTFREGAARFFRKAIERCPGLSDAYRDLARLHEDQDELPKAAAVLARLVQQDPRDFEAHVWLANHYLGQDQPDKSERHVEAVFRLKPRDPQSSDLRWSQRTTMIRCLIKQRLFEAARREWAEAAGCVPPDVEPYALDTMRAGIELKAKNLEGAQHYLDAALGKVGEPTVIWMQMSCLAARYKLPRDVRKDFDARFQAALKNPPTSETAGRLAGLLANFKSRQINYTGRATQERMLLAYLKCCDRVDWRAQDLRHVCDLLSQLPRQWELRQQFVSMAVQRFPHNLAFHAWTALIEIERGPFACDIGKATHHLDLVLKLAQQSPVSPADRKFVEDAKQTLAALHDIQEQRQRPRAFVGDHEGDWDDRYDEDDDEYERTTRTAPASRRISRSSCRPAVSTPKWSSPRCKSSCLPR